MTTGSIGGSRPGPKDHGGVSPKVGKFSEQVWGISSERQHLLTLGGPPPVLITNRRNIGGEHTRQKRQH